MARARKNAGTATDATPSSGGEGLTGTEQTAARTNSGKRRGGGRGARRAGATGGESKGIAMNSNPTYLRGFRDGSNAVLNKVIGGATT